MNSTLWSQRNVTTGSPTAGSRGLVGSYVEVRLRTFDGLELQVAEFAELDFQRLLRGIDDAAVGAVDLGHVAPRGGLRRCR